MYDDITTIYHEIFPLNQAFLDFLPSYLGGPGSAVLDLGCGPGDTVNALSRAGYQAVGIDSSAGMIQAAQSRQQGTFYPYSFEHIHLLKMRFACVYCVGNSLSYLPGPSLGTFLNTVNKLLKSEGSFVLQVVNWHRFRQTQTSDFPVKTLSAGRTFHRSYQWITPDRVQFNTQLRKGQEILNSWSAPLFPLYQALLADELQGAGFAVTGQFGGYDQTPFDPYTSPAMIATARK